MTDVPYESEFPLLDTSVADVLDTEPLLRRIRPEYFRGDGQAPSSAAFKTAELSVDREPMVVGGALKSSAAHPTHGLSRIPSAKIPRDLRLEVVRAPRPENMAHALVLGKKTDSVAKKLARCVVMLKPATAGASATDREA